MHKLICFSIKDIGLEEVKNELKRKISPKLPEDVQPEFKDNM